MIGIEWKKNLEERTQIETAINIRWLLIVLRLPSIYVPKSMFLLQLILEKLINIRKETSEVFVKWVNEYSKEEFLKLVINLRGVLNSLVIFI